MIKLSTNVICPKSELNFSFEDKIMLLGSCFSDEIGNKLEQAGFDILCNPFGTLYNPESIMIAIERLSSNKPFTKEDCVQMGAGSNLICSFCHHTSFARKTEEEFLANANKELEKASEFWRNCNKVIITFGSAWVWRKDGKTVSNCLKRPSKEFSRELLSLDEIIHIINSINKECLYTVSPIRHLGEFGAHSNTISKSLLHLSIDQTNKEYFPAYEILLDELRDYRFYSKDLIHPSETAVDIIWERFMNTYIDSELYPQIAANEKSSKTNRHIPINQ